MRRIRMAVSALLVAATAGADPAVPSPATAAAPASATEPPGIALSFQNTDIDAVLAYFGQITGDIFIKSDNVRGTISVTAPGLVSKTEALAILSSVLALHGFAIVPGPGRLRRVLPLADAVQSGVDVVDGATGAADDQLVTEVLPLRFLAAADVRGDLAGLLSRGGSLIADPRSNSLVVTDLASNIRRLGKVLAALDVRTPQVLIEALMVEVSLTTETKLGFEWSHAGSFTAKGHEFTDNLSADFGLSSLVTEGLTYAVMRGDGALKGLLKMLATDNNVNILSTPHVMAVNNQTAMIRVGEEVPVLTQTRNVEGGDTIRSFDFKDVSIELEVTPRISPDRDVFMKVHPLVKKILGFNAELNAPILATREAQTAVQVRDGDTVVIGGLMKDDRSIADSKIPILGDIPLLGWFFRSHDGSREKTELLVFITPHVILTPDEGQRVTVEKEAQSRGQPTPNRRAAKALYREGRRLEHRRDYVAAAARYREAAARAPDPGLRRASERRAARAEARAAKQKP